MSDVRNFISDAINLGAYKFILSGSRDKQNALRRVCFTMLNNEGLFFIEKLTEKQAFHSRIPIDSAVDEIIHCFEGFTQINAWSNELEFTAKLSKKGKLLIGKHKNSSAPERLSGQDRKKSYLIPEGSIVPPLIDMGVMTSNGYVRKPMYDKFRQINRFLEFIDESVKNDLPGIADESDVFTIIDFGCGKSYLTFIVYYYFSVLRHMNVRIIGIDLKKDVIDFCAALAQKYGYDNMHFISQDIADFAVNEHIDMVISLHACDTATDYALFHAVMRKAKYIFSVPCCQHEIAKNANLECMPIFGDDGILRERVSSLLTDGIRAKLLTACGYRTQLMEFVDLSHTPKNILIRAKKNKLSNEKRLNALSIAIECLNSIKCEQTLFRLLMESGQLQRIDIRRE